MYICVYVAPGCLGGPPPARREPAGVTEGEPSRAYHYYHDYHYYALIIIIIITTIISISTCMLCYVYY